MKLRHFFITIVSFLLTACSGLPLDPDQKKIISLQKKDISNAERQGAIPYDGKKGRVALYVFSGPEEAYSFYGDDLIDLVGFAYLRIGGELYRSACLVYYAPDIAISPSLTGCEILLSIQINKAGIADLSNRMDEEIDKISDELKKIKVEISDLSSRIDEELDKISDDLERIKVIVAEQGGGLKTSLEAGLINNSEIVDIYKRIKVVSDQSEKLRRSSLESASKVDVVLSEVKEKLDEVFKRIDSGIPNYR